METGRNLEIAILCQWFPPEIAPIGVMLHEIATDLGKSGHHVSVITGFPNYPDGILFPGYKRKLSYTEQMENYRVIRCFMLLPTNRSLLAKLFNYMSFQISSFIALLRLRNLDVIYVVSPPLSNAGTALIMKGLKGVNYVLNVQDIYPDAAIHTGAIRNGLLIALLSRFERWAYKHASRILVIGQGFVSNIKSKGAAPDKIRLVRNWIDLERVRPGPKANQFSREHSVADKFVVLYSGTLGRVSGVDVLVDCAEMLLSHDDVLFLVVGEGALKESMRKDAQNRQLSNMLFLPFQNREVLSDLQASADVSIVTLKHNQGASSIPSKVLGYMAAARPVIASVDDGTDISALVAEADCGLVVAAGKSESIAHAILALKNDKERAGRFGRNGRKFLEDNLQRDVCVRQIRQVIESSRC